MPITLGILAQSRQAVAASDFVLLETQVLTSNETSVTFSNLSQYASTYKHLQIRAVFRTNRSAFTASYWGMRFNGDTSTNYSWHWLNGGYSGSTPESSGTPNANTMRTAWSPGATASANLFASSVTDILDAFSTSKNKTTRTIAGKTENEQMVLLGSGNWRNTNAVSSITIHDELGAQFVPNSRFSIYGVK